MNHEDYTIGWICALPIETAAAYGVLDERHSTSPPPNDNNNYTFGRIGQHNVVIACLPSGVMGIASASRVVERMTFTFPSLRFVLMVGIGGGVPSAEHDIRLGDVVVSKPVWASGGVIQYDYGMTTQEGRFVRTGSLNRPPDVLLTASANLEARNLVDGHRISYHLSETVQKFPKLKNQFTSPGPDHDSLYNMGYEHPKDEPTCSSCKKSELVHREPRLNGEIVVHYGLIASADQVMKHGQTRERLRRELDVLCFEMEAAGLMDAAPCLVVRGICDYSDSHKNYQWQPFAAATASAYAKEILGFISPTKAKGERLAKQIIEDTPIPASQGTTMISGIAAQKHISPGISPGVKVESTHEDAIAASVVSSSALSNISHNLNEFRLGSSPQGKERPEKDKTNSFHELHDGMNNSWRKYMDLGTNDQIVANRLFTLSSEADATFLLMKSLLPKDDVKLGRFVRRPQHPGEGYAPQTPIVSPELLSESLEKDVNRILVQKVDNKGFRFALSRALGVSKDKVETTFRSLRSRMIVTRRFNNADTRLQDLLTQETRDWLKEEAQVKAGVVYLVVGIKTFIDTEIIGAKEKSKGLETDTQLAANAKSDHGAVGPVIMAGEQVFAVQYRPMKLKKLSLEPIAHLGNSTYNPGGYTQVQRETQQDRIDQRSGLFTLRLDNNKALKLELEDGDLDEIGLADLVDSTDSYQVDGKCTFIFEAAEE